MGGVGSTMVRDEPVKLGVVIFQDDNYSDEGLAALQWAARALPRNLSAVYILLIEKEAGPNETTHMAPAVAADIKQSVTFYGDEVSLLFPDDKDTFDKYIDEIHIELLHGRSYKGGTNIQETLKGAIKEYDIDTLILGMAAVESNPTTRHIDLQMDSKCSVVLAKTKPLDRPLRISATPLVAPAPADPANSQSG